MGKDIEQRLSLLTFLLHHELRHFLQYLVLNIIVKHDAYKIFSWYINFNKLKLELDAELFIFNNGTKEDLYNLMQSIVEEYEYYNE